MLYVKFEAEPEIAQELEKEWSEETPKLFANMTKGLLDGLRMLTVQLLTILHRELLDRSSMRREDIQVGFWVMLYDRATLGFYIYLSYNKMGMQGPAFCLNGEEPITIPLPKDVLSRVAFDAEVRKIEQSPNMGYHLAREASIRLAADCARQLPPAINRALHEFSVAMRWAVWTIDLSSDDWVEVKEEVTTS